MPCGQSSIALADEIVIIHNQSLLTICHTGTMKIAQQFLLFRIDTDHRLPVCEPSG